MPDEFWREVVDRVAAEAPDTLLLAEAFWLMEGYFVRTLGMHRVYNSAFMNMLRDEENANYRSVIKNTLEFDPEILKRYVNFMNNPDERTAVDQFGKGDKYFGVCTLMATLPGLPMFGHGQVEGFTERYGMEYRRAYWDEPPDAGWSSATSARSSRCCTAAPLFAEARDFLLYDFFTDDGPVNEDVFAYSNRRGDERALVLYHNRYARTRAGSASRARTRRRRRTGDRHLVQADARRGAGRLGRGRDVSRLPRRRHRLEHLHRSARSPSAGCASCSRRTRATCSSTGARSSTTRRIPGSCWPTGWTAAGCRALAEAMLVLQLEPVHAALRALLDPARLASLAAGRVREARAAARAGRPSLRALLTEAAELRGRTRR